MTTPENMTEVELFLTQLAQEEDDQDGAVDIAGAEDQQVDQQQGQQDQIPQGYGINPEMLELQRRQMEINEQLAAAIKSNTASDVPNNAVEEDLYRVAPEQISAEEIEAFRDSSSYVSKVAKNEVANVINDVVAKVLAPMRTEMQATQRELAMYKEQAVAQSNYTAEAQLRAMTQQHIPDYNNFVKSNEWQNYLNTDIPGASGAKYMQVAKLHSETGNLNAIAEMMIEAKKRAGAGATRVAPGSTVTPSPKNQATGSFSATKFAEFTESFQRGDITAAQYDKVRDAFAVAAMRGAIT